jgi:hypothetical protein
MGIAKIATMKDNKIKMMVWGESGTGKSRFALTAPMPLVIDLENSTDWYSNEFKFYRAKKNEKDELCKNATVLTKNILDEIIKGEYPEVKTLVIDPITDLLENIEVLCTKEYERQALKGKKQILELNALEKTKFYSFRRDKTREMLDRILSLDMNIILIARAKNNWETSGGQLKTNGKTFDGIDLLEYLPDFVINLVKENNNTIGYVKKSRIGNLPNTIDKIHWNTIESNAFDVKDIEFETIEPKKETGLSIINKYKKEKEAV